MVAAGVDYSYVGAHFVWATLASGFSVGFLVSGCVGSERRRKRDEVSRGYIISLEANN